MSVYHIGYEDNPMECYTVYHIRQEAIVHYVLQGTGYVNGVPVHAGQGFYLPPNVYHAYHPDPENPWQYCWFTASPEVGRQFLVPMLEPDKNGVFECPYIGQVERIFSQLIECPRAIQQSEAFYHIFSLLRLHQPQTASSGLKQELHVRKAKEYIEAHLSERLTVGDVANAVFLHPQYLSTLFLRYERMTTKDYILHTKLYSACKLLLQSQLQIKEIAHDLGFSDIYTFSKIFKAKIGMSPREYRSRNKDVLI